MKKRLLITSIVMMLVVAVALSTATYAWFTSNARVDAASITMTAATNEEASLGISWTDGNYTTQIVATSPAGDVFSPAAPTELTVNTTTSEVDFYTALATPGTGVNAGDMVFKTDSVQETDVYTWTDTTHESFFIKNLSPANPISSITMTATISNNLLRVGVFKKDGNSYKLLGVLANDETYTYSAVAAETKLTADAGTYFKKRLGKYVPAVPGTEAEVANGTADYFRDADNSGASATEATANTFYTRTETAARAQAAYGTVTAGNSVNALTTTACVTSIDIVGATPLAANGVIELVVLVWEDAIALGDAEGNTSTTVSLMFNA